jgi:leucyl/phenylalanyl-tRNA--protein transferase
MTLTPDMLLDAYANGYFPMAMATDDPELYWFSPEERGVLPLDAFNIPRGLKRVLPKLPYRVTVDTAFDAVIRACGTLTPQRRETWINETIIELYNTLHRQGHAHSIEVWEDKKGLEVGDWGLENRASSLQPPVSSSLIGGLYGISLGGAFFGESMFSRAAEASKLALVTLVEVLNEAGYSLLDTQYVNEHLKQFGVVAMPKEIYMTKLENALSASPNPSSFFSTVSVRRGLASSSSVSDT